MSLFDLGRLMSERSARPRSQESSGPNLNPSDGSPMRKFLSAAAIGVFTVGFIWQYGSWIAEWGGRFAGLRGVTAGYDEFVERHVPLLAMKGGVTEIVAPWMLMAAGVAVFWILRLRPTNGG